MHIARGLYYSSYKTPRVLLWSIGVIIFIVMMAEIMWPNCKYNQIIDIFYRINFDLDLLSDEKYCNIVFRLNERGQYQAENDQT